MAGDHHTTTGDIAMASLVLYAADLDRTAAFYRTIGLDLVDEQHDDGPVHSVTTLAGDVHVAIYRSEGMDPVDRPAWQQAGSTFPGVWVGSLDTTTEALRAEGHPVLLDHQQRSWGCRVVVEDPDGRPVEVNQRDHCTLFAEHP